MIYVHIRGLVAPRAFEVTIGYLDLGYYWLMCLVLFSFCCHVSLTLRTLASLRSETLQYSKGWTWTRRCLFLSLTFERWVLKRRLCPLVLLIVDIPFSHSLLLTYSWKNDSSTYQFSGRYCFLKVLPFGEEERDVIFHILFLFDNILQLTYQIKIANRYANFLMV